ncbi:MAG: redoxin domain-containing protein [Verrucomicrobiota bacterium]
MRSVAQISLAIFFCLAPLHAAPIEIEDIQGAAHRPLEQKEKSATVLIFILPDCPVANGYAPELRRIFETYSKSNVAFYLVHVDPDLKSADARKHAQDFGYTMPVLLDPKHELVKFTKATVTPEAAVLSPQGKLLYRGRIDDRVADYGKKRAEPTQRDLRDALDAILAGQPVKNPATKAIGCFIPELEKK